MNVVIPTLFPINVLISDNSILESGKHHQQGDPALPFAHHSHRTTQPRQLLERNDILKRFTDIIPFFPGITLRLPQPEGPQPQADPEVRWSRRTPSTDPTTAAALLSVLTERANAGKHGGNSQGVRAVPGGVGAGPPRAQGSLTLATTPNARWCPAHSGRWGCGGCKRWRCLRQPHGLQAAELWRRRPAPGVQPWSPEWQARADAGRAAAGLPVFAPSSSSDDRPPPSRPECRPNDTASTDRWAEGGRSGPSR